MYAVAPAASNGNRLPARPAAQTPTTAGEVEVAATTDGVGKQVGGS